MSRYLNKQDYKKSIIAYFEKVAKMTIQEAKKKIKKELIIDKYGNTENDTISALNVHVFYTANPNFGRGKKNGYGKGFYISSGHNDIKI